MIFLDVGAHEGQTLEEVVKPEYGFEQIYAFEPMPRQFEVLVERFGSNARVRMLRIGLGAKTAERPLYGDNANMGASLYPAKRDVDAKVETYCYFVAARVIFDALTGPLIVKLNCEGAEVEILDSLIDGDQLGKIANVLIDFDIRKVTGREAEAERILERLAAVGFDRYSLAEEVMVGATHQQRIARWLEGVLASR